MAIEEAFDIEISDGEAESIETVKDAVEYLKNHNLTPIDWDLTK